MSSKVFPSTGEKPKFDPNAAYEAVQDTPVPKGNKPAFDPNKKFEVVKDAEVSQQVPEKAIAQPQPAFQLSEPTLRAIPKESVVTPSAPNEQINIQRNEVGYVPDEKTYKIQQQQGKAKIAHEKVSAALTSNDAQYEKKLRESRRDNFTVEALRDQYKQNGQILSPQDEQKLLQKEKDRLYNLPVTKDQLTDFKTGTILTPKLSRKFIKDLNDKDVAADAHAVDKFNEIINDPDPNAYNRIEKINEVTKGIRKGTYVYDPETKTVVQPLGLIGSMMEGVKNKFKGDEEHDFLKNTTNNSAIISQLEDERNNPDRDEPIKVPRGKVGEVLKSVAEMPMLPMVAGVAGTIGGTFIGNPELGTVAATALGAYENRKAQYRSTFKQVYNEMRDQGKPEFDALTEARHQAENAQEIGTIVGAAQGYLGGKIGAIPIKGASFNLGYQNAIGDFLKKNGSDLGKIVLDAAAQGGLGAAGEITKNKLAQAAGIKRDWDEGTESAFWGNALMTAGIGAAIKLGRGISKVNYKTILSGLTKSVPEEAINSAIQEKVTNGEITQDAATQALNEINQYKTKDSQIPPNVTEEARFKIQDNIDKINELQAQKEATHESLQGPIKEKIQKLIDDNLALAKETVKEEKPVSGLEKSKEKEAIDFAHELVDEGILPDTYGEEVKKDPIKFWQTVAQQAQNRDENWNPLLHPLDEQAVRDNYGDTVVDYAKELFPAPEVHEIPASVSVIQPGEIKQPEAITIAPKEPTEKIGHVEVSEHGEDTKTAAGEENGVKPSKLTEAGRKEAEELGRYLVDNNKKKIIVSEVERAQETAKVAAQKAGIPVETNPILNTWDIGHYDGKPEGSFVEEAWVNKPSEAPKGGESFNDFTKRMEQAYEYVKSLPEDNHVITHSKVMRALDALSKTDGKWTEETTKEFLNNKELTHAVPIEKSDAMDVRQQAANGEGVGAGNVQSEGPAGEEIGGQTKEEGNVKGQEEVDNLPFKYDEGDDIITSIKNATTAQKVEEYGLAPAVQEAARKHGAVWQEAIQKVRKGYDTQSLVNQLKKKPRPLTDTEDALLLIHQIEKEANYDAINKEINEAGEKGDYAAMDEAKIRRQAIKDDLQDLYDVDKKVGTANARGLSARQMMADRRYSLVNMEQEAQAAQNGRPLTEEQKAEVQKDYENIKAAKDAYAKRIVELEQENQKLRERGIEEKIKRENKKDKIKKSVDKIKGDLKSNIDELRRIARDQGLGANPIALEAIPVILKTTKNLAKLGIVKVEQMAIHIYDAIKDQYDDKLTVAHVMEAIEAAHNHERLEAYKARTQKSIDAITDKMNVEHAPNKPTKPPIILDAQALKLKAAEERAKASYEEKIKKQELKERTKGQKAQDWFVKWERAFKLSGITTLGKLSGAAITRLTTSPIEEGIGGVYSALIPKLAKRAEGEAGFNVKAEAKAITSAFTKGMKDAAETIKLGTKGGKGKSDLDIVFGKKDALPPEAIDFFGQLHSALKAPVKRAAFERSMTKRMARNIKNGVDVSDPMVQSRIAMEAYKDGQRAIFMQDNFVSDSYRNWVNSLEKSQKYPTLGKGAATIFQWMVPFVKVPTNIVGEVGTHVAGVPIAAGKLLHASFTKGIEHLAPEEADMIMRNLKKGSLGVAALLLGYFNPNNFGGYYQKYEKRDEGDIQAGEARAFGVTIPKWLLHSPIYETMQLGATVRRAKDKMVHGIPKGMTEGMWAGTLGLLEEEPLLDQPMRFAKIFEGEKERRYYLGELAKSTVDPILLQNVAKWIDPAQKRKPETLWEHIETGLPGLRENVPEKGGNNTGGGAGGTGKYTKTTKQNKQGKLSKTKR